MNNIKIFGKKPINETQKCSEYKLTFKNIYELCNNNLLLRLPFQIDIDEDKINSMIMTYYKNPEYLIFKNKIILGYVIKTNNIYIIDGQHRIEMVKKLYINDINDYLIFCCYKIDNDNEMKLLFKEINLDSYKNNKYITLNDFNVNLYDLCKNYLYNNYSLYFAEKKSTYVFRISISEFLNKLLEYKYIEKFYNIESLIEDLENKNKKFNKLIDYQEYFNDNPELFYKDEYNCVKDGKIFSLKNNNFIEYIIDTNIIPNHKFKLQKKIIGPKLRIQVWQKEFGNIDNGICPFNDCNNNIHNGKNGFHCGHIISEFNGGLTILDNLKPICSNCNLKMGKNNWII